MESKSQSKIPLLESIVKETEVRGWTQRVLAQKAGVAPSVVSRIFNGGSANMKNVSALLECLNLKVVRANEFGSDRKEPDYDNIINIYKELAEARKELADHKEKIRKLEIALLTYKVRFKQECRKGDPPGFNALSLRKPVVLNSE